VLLAALAGFGAPKQGRKLLMKRGEGLRHLLKLDLVHGLISSAALPLSWRSL
jgi:hypothetical protein